LAGYSDQRDQNLDIKYLRKALGGLDASIQTPERLSPSALLSKLDGIEQEVPTEKKVRELVLPRRPGLRSWITYAAAFALIVGLFYGLGHNQQGNIAIGELSLAEQADLGELSEGGGSRTAGADNPPANPIPASGEGVIAIEAPPADGETPFAGGETDVFVGFEGALDAVGGTGMGQVLGGFGEFILSYRPNDNADPDHHSDAPNVLFLLSSDGSEILSQIDLPLMREVAAFHGHGDILALVGRGEESTYIYTVDYTDVENPVALLLLSQPGSLADEIYFDGFLYVASHSPYEHEYEVDQVVYLEDSISQGTATFTLVNLSDGSASRTSALGASEQVQLYRTEARIFFAAQSEEDEEPAEWMARVDIISATMQMLFAGAEPLN